MRRQVQEAGLGQQAFEKQRSSDSARWTGNPEPRLPLLGKKKSTESDSCMIHSVFEVGFCNAWSLIYMWRSSGSEWPNLIPHGAKHTP